MIKIIMDKIFDKVKEKYKYLIMFIPIENGKAIDEARKYNFIKIKEDQITDSHCMIIMRKDLN